jgi:hypothetical protein
MIIDKKLNIVTNLKNIAKGNPGAMTVMLMLLGYTADGRDFRKPTDNPLGDFRDGMSRIEDLDKWGIHGSDIWICYKDLCDQNVDALVSKIDAGLLASELKEYKEAHGL